MVVGAATLGCSLRAGATLLAFYASSSKLTTLKEELKEVDDEFKRGGQRDWVQVSLRPIIARLVHDASEKWILVSCVCHAYAAHDIRTAMQVCCNALIPTVIAVLMGYWGGLADLPMDAQRMPGYTAAAGAFLGYFACCCGDTWASEVGQLSAQQPRLITSLRPVRKVGMLPLLSSTKLCILKRPLQLPYRMRVQSLLNALCAGRYATWLRCLPK